MGGGASKRAALAEELNSRVAARDEDTLSMVEQDKKRRQQKKLALAVQAAWRGHEGRRRAWENEQAVRRWADEVVRHPHRPLPGDPVAYYRGTLRGRDALPRWDGRAWPVPKSASLASQAAGAPVSGRPTPIREGLEARLALMHVQSETTQTSVLAPTSAS